MIKFILVSVLIFISFAAKAQTSSEATESFDYYLELITELSARDEVETDYNDLAIELYDLWESPVNINSADTYEFGRLFWLSEIQLNNLIAYVKKQRPVVSLYELAYVPGFDTTLVLSLKPFILISEAPDKSTFKPRSKNMLLLRIGRTLEEQRGFMENNFEGDAWKQNLRYKYQYGEKVFAGFNLEKDAGEALFKGSNKAGPDFYSGYLKVNNLGIFKSVCIGSYSIGIGQGLVAGPGFALGKSSQAVNLIQKETSIRPYTSTDENRYFQGVAASLSIKPVELTIFFSYKKVDANVTLKDSTGKVLEVSALQTTGYHTITNEINDENSIAELTAGSRLLFRKSKFQVGAAFIHSGFNAEITPEINDYNRFYFRGSSQSNFGLDYKYNFSNTILFGEEAIDALGNSAFLNGLTSNVGGRLQFSFLHRHYSRAYQSFYGNAFGENSKVQNEDGIYGGIRMSLVKHINLAFYTDFFHFPWLKYGVDAPSYGKEFMIQAEYNSNGSFLAFVQLRFKQKQTNSADSAETLNNVVLSESQRLRFHVTYQANSQLSLSTRLELSSSSIPNLRKNNGYMIYQDFKYAFTKVPFQVYLRYALFDTDDYNSRIYAYESDVLYAFSVSAYFMQGQRYYAMVKYTPLKWLDLWFKYSQTVYPNEKSISSGLYQIDGNSRTDIRFQMILKF